MIQEIPGIDTSRCTYCRKCVEYCEFNAIVVIPPARFAEINPSLCHSCGACSVACEADAIWVKNDVIGRISRFEAGPGHHLLEGRLKIGSPMQTMVIRRLKRQIPHEADLVILDAPPGTSCPVVETLADADYIILVTEPTPFGLHDLKLMVKLVRELNIPFGVVINKNELGNGDVREYLHHEGIEVIGKIPFSRDYAACYAGGDLFHSVPEQIGSVYASIMHRLEEKLQA